MLNHRKISRTVTAPAEGIQNLENFEPRNSISEKCESRNSKKSHKKQRVKTVGSRAQNEAPIVHNRASLNNLENVDNASVIRSIQNSIINNSVAQLPLDVEIENPSISPVSDSLIKQQNSLKVQNNTSQFQGPKILLNPNCKIK